ncbi:hypothetical protein FEM48_Zijuj07G0163900 [Ziziphus jujuba var. spinosa]|uniref:Glycosyl transferase CAP10 domain-containing protein n=1 Tax=Ziziphus jujuba var. spinosa TaxID=714518 RepID=A0A978V5P3_ZIZJJ|nr:hypothetical protein FEM48_Zijuj07G0163900 [Ziziphus jujuba var. spinosa]
MLIGEVEQAKQAFKDFNVGDQCTHRGIGKAGSKFIQENVKMKYAYDYLFHVLDEYAKQLKFKPSIKTSWSRRNINGGLFCKSGMLFKWDME